MQRIARDPSFPWRNDWQTGAMKANDTGAAGSQDSIRGRGNYGIDGGAITIGVYGAVLAGMIVTVLEALRQHRKTLAVAAGLAGMVGAGSAIDYLYSSGPGKRAVWAELLDELHLDGNERVLDVGCGRGAVLMLAAHRVPNGRAVGVDVWRRRDQSGNARAATEHNAVVEGMSDRVEIIDGDARDLPFPSASFDVVVSNMVIHNVRDATERDQVLHQIVRVLRPGGRLCIVDLFGADRYSDVLRDEGCIDVGVRRLDWRTWFGIPGHHLTLISASTPPG